MKKKEIINIIRESGLENHEAFNIKNYNKHKWEATNRRAISEAIDKTCNILPYICMIL